MQVTLWICPTDGCGNYYGSSTAPDLSKAMNSDAKGQETFLRSRCPDCHQRGVEVHRVPRVINIAPKVFIAL